MKRCHVFTAGLAFLGLANAVSAHQWHQHGDDHHTHAGHQAADSSPTKGHRLVALTPTEKTVDRKPEIARHFAHFKNVKTRWNSNTLFVESNGLPTHDMMVGIRSWQQQVPLPQPFVGDNAWQIPLEPELADKPVSAKKDLFRGAIALAVNGVPIFNALNNRGEDAFLAGELDQWGGHCGRGDDYHYHIAPVHLEKVVGAGNPIAFALDGFPIYGLTESDGSPVGKLDEFNGQFDADGHYHYHATKTYPYINGGMRGVVSIRGGQIEPQPRDAPVRPAFQPLRGARITAFESNAQRSVLTYEVNGKTGTVSYTPVSDTSWEFAYAEPGGRKRTETYKRRSGPTGRDARRPPPGNNRPPRGR